MAREKINLSTAATELGWFSTIFSWAISAPSALSILQAIFVERRLVHALQWIPDGYNAIIGILAGMVEPVLAPPIAWIGHTLDWQLSIQPVWRPLFLLSMIFVAGWARTSWRDGEKIVGILVVLVGGVFVALSSVLASAVPVNGGWLQQGVVAAVLSATVWISLGIVHAMRDVKYGQPEEMGETFGGWAISAAQYSGTAFILAAGLAMLPVHWVNAGPATVSVALTILGFGLSIVVGYLARPTDYNLRLGLTIVGGFVTAALIVIASELMKCVGSI